MARDRCSSGRSAAAAIGCSALLLGVSCLLAASDLGAATPTSADAERFQYGVLDLPELEHELDFSSGYSERRRRDAPQPMPSTQDQPPPRTEQQQATPKPTVSASVSYLTGDQVNGTAAGPSPSAPSATPSSSPQTPASSPAKPVLVSTPIVPSTADPAGNKTTPGAEATDKPKIKVWANQTMWSNVTSAKVHNVGETDLDDFSIDKYPAEVTNNTLKEKNVTSETDTHQYYNSTFSIDETTGRQYWVDLDKHPDKQINLLLSKSHRRAATIKLKFDFPFYGHKVRNITIATGGFLYTGEYVHSWLAATQYIAPLMANFDTTLSDDSFVKYADNGTALTVEWENVQLQDKPEAGAFTFQVTLLQNGDIIFVYSAIPVLVESIEDKEHPVKIGLSDAYMMDRTVFFARRKTIYEYHRVNFNRQDIKNWTVIYLKALPTCLQMDNCNDCLTKIKDFECKWCGALQKCSTGTFRFRQEWLQKGCDALNVRDEAKCPQRSGPASGSAAAGVYREPLDPRSEVQRAGDEVVANYSPSQQAAVGPASSSLEHAQDNMNMGVSGIIGVLFIISLIAGLVAWAGYAYRNPHSASGQMLIRYRPSQWSWRRGEARYTAATIHM